jgi:hypothetical protein
VNEFFWFFDMMFLGIFRTIRLSLRAFTESFHWKSCLTGILCIYYVNSMVAHGGGTALRLMFQGYRQLPNNNNNKTTQALHTLRQSSLNTQYIPPFNQPFTHNLLRVYTWRVMWNKGCGEHKNSRRQINTTIETDVMGRTHGVLNLVFIKLIYY